jgi:hypothetical protein
VIAHRCVVQPNPSATKRFLDRHVAAGDGISDEKGDLIQRYIIYAKPPDEILDITHVFLMGFRGEECLEQPAAFMNLLNVANLFEGSDALPHYRNLPWAVKNFLDRYGFGGASVDDALVIADGREGSTLVEHAPILLYDSEQSLGILR